MINMLYTLSVIVVFFIALAAAASVLALVMLLVARLVEKVARRLGFTK